MGIDNLNDYCDPALKWARLGQLSLLKNFAFHQIDLADISAMVQLFSGIRFDKVGHPAAKAGIRYFILNPHACAESNMVG